MIILRTTTFLGIFLATFSFFFVGSLEAKERKNTPEEYINRYKSIAMEHQVEYGIPASITMAQGILESSSGNSILARGSNNHFGIKCKSYWKGKTFTHTDDAPDECFRAYDSVEESYQDHATFLESSSRYDSLFLLDDDDYEGWAHGLKKAGYATAPDYAPRLIKIIEDYKLHDLDKQALAHVGGETGRTVVTATLKSKPAYHGQHISVYASRPLYRTNGSLYVIAEEGDSYGLIAEHFDLKEKQLRQYNELQLNASIKTGDVLFIEPKAHVWRAKELTHRVAEGENLHTIAQRYGITQSRLRKVNKMKRTAQARLGSDLNIR